MIIARTVVVSLKQPANSMQSTRSGKCCECITALWRQAEESGLLGRGRGGGVGGNVPDECPAV